MSISLYRKYRPTTFADVVGQAHITRTLTNAVRQDRVSHAYLFAGPRGTGKTSTAKILAMALNCEAGRGKATPHPDGTCANCQAIRRGSSMDVLEIDAASNRGIDEIREIRDRVNFAPVQGRMKVYIVDEVHMLTPEAFNALLKMLEEPPPHVVFVLATTEPHKILPTILSRCQRLDFRRPSVPEIVQVLMSVADREGIAVSENTLSVIARAAGGSFRDAIGSLDQLSAYCEGTITLQDALAILGVAEQDLLFEIVDIVEARDTQAALLFVERLSQSGADLNQFMRDLLGHLRDLYVVQHTIEPPDSVAASQEHLDGLRSQANRIGTPDLVSFIDLVGGAQRAVRQGADPRLELELVLIKLTRPETEATVRGLMARLEKLEAALQASPGVSSRSGRPTTEHQATSPGVATRYQALSSTPAATPGAGAVDTRAAPEAAPAPAGAAPAPRGSAATPGETSAAAAPTAATPAAAPTPGGIPAATPAAATPAAQIEPTLDNLRRAWTIILTAVKKRRPSLYALLTEARPDELEGDVLILRFPPGLDFQAAQVNRADNQTLLADTLRHLTGRSLGISARVAEGPESAKASPEERATLLTKEELIDLLKKEFDARPIDDEAAR